MKKLLAFCLIFLLSYPAFAEIIDLSGLSYDELVALKDQINIAMWQSEEWQEVAVPEGIWEIGKDIPAGHWTITVKGKGSATITYGNRLDRTGKQISYDSSVFYYKIVNGPQNWSFHDGDTNYIDLDLIDGYYIELSGGVVFTPYTGKPSFTFK